MLTDLVAVVPLRSPGDGKTRLAPTLDRADRAELAAAMLADVVRAVRTAGVRVVVAAGGPAAVRAAERLEAEVVPDGAHVRSLDEAIEHVHRQVRPRGGLLVVQADLPLLTGPDIAALCSIEAPVVVAPTDDGGTSALLRRPGGVMGTAFGPDSAAAHQRLARRAGVESRLVRRPGLAHDVDVLADLQALGPAVGPQTAGVLTRLHLPRPG